MEDEKQMEENISETAEETPAHEVHEEPQEQISIGLDLSVASYEVIELLLEESEDPAIFEEIATANKRRPDILRLIYDHPHTPDKIRAEVAGILSLPVKTSSELQALKEKILEKPKFESMQAKIQKLGVMERVKLAQKGSREIRSLLIKDTNKQVVLSVMGNPKITTTEVEMIARSRNIIEEVLRLISKNQEWMKNYSVMLALVTNPRTPPTIAIGYISSLKLKDLEFLSKNKGVAELIRTVAKRLVTARKKGK